MHSFDLGRIADIWRDDYDPARAYAPRDVVRHENAIYRCLKPTASGIVPGDADHWGLMMAAPHDGVDGTRPDVAHNWTAPQRIPFVAANGGIMDMNAGQNFTVTPAGNITLRFSNLANGQSGRVYLNNSAMHTVEVVGISWIGTPPQLVRQIMLTYITDGTAVWVSGDAIGSQAE